MYVCTLVSISSVLGRLQHELYKRDEAGLLPRCRGACLPHCSHHKTAPRQCPVGGRGWHRETESHQVGVGWGGGGGEGMYVHLCMYVCVENAA